MSRYVELLQRINKVDSLMGELAGAYTGAPSKSRADALPVRKSRVKSSDAWHAALVQEEEAKLVQRVFLAQNSKSPHVVTCCSADDGNGSATICARLAESLARQVPGTVCVVDGNLRSPALHHFFTVENLEGLAEAVLLDRPWEACVRNFRENLHFITAGQEPAHPHTLFASEAFRLKMKALRARFDYVLIDSPPVTQYADASMVAPLTDGVILVIEAEATRRETALSAKESIEAASSTVLAAVLNNRTFPIPHALYRRL